MLYLQQMKINTCFWKSKIHLLSQYSSSFSTSWGYTNYSKLITIYLFPEETYCYLGWFTGELKRTCYFWVTKSIKNIAYIFAFDCLFYTKLFLLTSPQCFTGKGVSHFRLRLHIPHKGKLLELSSPVCDLHKTTYVLVNFWHASWIPDVFLLLE